MTITERRERVMELSAMTNGQIAEVLGVSVRTVVYDRRVLRGTPTRPPRRVGRLRDIVDGPRCPCGLLLPCNHAEQDAARRAALFRGGTETAITGENGAARSVRRIAADGRLV